jgi:hypothetical protein
MYFIQILFQNQVELQLWGDTVNIIHRGDNVSLCFQDSCLNCIIVLDDDVSCFVKKPS